MKSVSLTAYPRTNSRRTGLKKVRGNNRVPAVIYGQHNPPQSLELNLKDLERLILHSVTENLLIDLSVEGDPKPKRLALVQDVQHHPLRGTMLHIDLHEVIETEKVTLVVPVETVGEPAGVKTGGGVLEHVLFKIKVRALPKDLPEVLQVDVSAMEVGQTIHVSDLKLDPGVEVLADPKIVVLSVAGSRTAAQEEAEAAAGGVATQPEMIKEKKETAKGGKK
ncbi:MAG: 50S ribosomal protein L25 [Verrucomicrobia bacterium]|jgi:large subunit ribosomal protein L25|nr:50S ribosomal protein L25 [Verrucomicrobiota bacterium]